MYGFVGNTPLKLSAKMRAHYCVEKSRQLLDTCRAILKTPQHTQATNRWHFRIRPVLTFTNIHTPVYPPTSTGGKGSLHLPAVSRKLLRSSGPSVCLPQEVLTVAVPIL